MTYELPQVSIRMVRENTLVSQIPVTDVATAVSLIRDYIKDWDREVFMVLTLDTKKHAINVATVHIGSLRMCPVSVKEVFKTAILSNAEGIICFHNHPSGDVTPSEEDIDITHKLKEAGKLLEVFVIDHIIVGSDGTYFSFLEQDMLK